MALASSSTSRALARARASSSSSPSSSVPPTRDDDLCALKTKLFLLSAQTDRGQLLFRQKVYNMEDYFRAKEQQARVVVENIVSSGECKLATSPDIQDGTWELAYSTAQLFRCSPFFLAIAESMEGYTWRAPWSDESTAVCSSELFFRLHELQVMSWGASTVGKVTQTVDTSSATLSSTFDTILFRQENTLLQFFYFLHCSLLTLFPSRSFACRARTQTHRHPHRGLVQAPAYFWGQGLLLRLRFALL